MVPVVTNHHATRLKSHSGGALCLPPRSIALTVLPLLLSACAMDGGWLTTVGPDYQPTPLPVAEHWQAPQPDAPTLPHHGDPAGLARWWQRFDDPVLSRLLAAAQSVSASVAQAKARIEEARAGLTGAEVAAIPSLDTDLNAGRSVFSFGGPVFTRTQYQWNLQSNWEIDLFGGMARQREAAQSRLDSRNASWHDARVAVAVETANAYLAYRYAEARRQLASADAESRAESARLAAIAGRAGFRAPADVALAAAGAAEGKQGLLQQQAQCERLLQGLVALTGLEPAEARRLLTGTPERQARLPTPPPFRVDALPARVLLQRPDLAAAERDVAAASAAIGVEQAKRFPRLSLTGNIAYAFQNMNAASLLLAQTWSVGPTLSLPLFDAGKRAADVDAARAQYEAAVAGFHATARTAVQEVETALVRLHSAGERLPQARSAAAGYHTSWRAAQDLYQAGLGSLLDAETARRNALAADLTVVELEQERVSAWIALYRAAGGAWEDDGGDAVSAEHG
ncbi:MAG: efflux transporter outer membrane subunit [Methylococcaceae bacterium]|nr:MAG: efflux transporter outer membrane subunit [Methylococcaceae bacterium]